MLSETGQIEMKLGQAVVEYEVQLEGLVLKPLQQLLEHEFPNINKLRRQLSKLTENRDAAKAKLQQASRHSVGREAAGKIDSFKEEWEEAQQKMEHHRVCHARWNEY